MSRERDSYIRIQMVVTPNFNLLATVGFVDPFRVANYLDGSARFSCDFVSEAGGLCPASNGASIDTRRLEPDVVPDIAIVSTSWTPERYASPRLVRTLRDWSRRGVTLGALDTGAFVLAKAGLLEDVTATVHYEHMDAFQELYADTALSENLCVFDGARLSCCGGTAAVDFGLHVLQGIHGSALANAVARYIFHPGLRDRAAPQQPDGSEPLGNSVPAVIRSAIRLMEAHLEEPRRVPDICAEIGISHRQLDRLFATYLKKSPAIYYRDIRLDRARGLVTQTEMPIAEVAVASGFASQVHFSRAYKERFGLPPIKDRIAGRIPFEFRAWPMHRTNAGHDQ